MIYHSVLAVVRKNCEPFVFGPELAIDKTPEISTDKILIVEFVNV